jgi:hypothetical protein
MTMSKRARILEYSGGRVAHVGIGFHRGVGLTRPPHSIYHVVVRRAA